MLVVGSHTQVAALAMDSRRPVVALELPDLVLHEGHFDFDRMLHGLSVRKERVGNLLC